MSGLRFIPNLDPAQISHGSERHVAQCLAAGLDSEWTVFHSYCWLREDRSHRGTTLREGEADFVLLHRRFGLLVLEVKGGNIRFDPAQGLWWQNNHGMKDPFSQAQGNMHALVNQLTSRAKFVAGGGLPCAFGHAVVFPDCNFTGTLPQGAHEWVTFSERHCKELGKHVLQALKGWARRDVQDLHASDYEQIRQGLTSTFKIVTSLARDVQKDEEVLVQLTEQQAEALHCIYSNERVLIEGTAGSGKTLLALERAKSFAAEGKRVLFLCFNRKLADWLGRRTRDVAGLKVANFHALCAELSKEARVPWSPPADPVAASRFWSEEAAELLLEAADELPDHRYDAIVVDEAQDFHDDWWTAIESLHSKHNGPLYIFFDRVQNLYRNDLHFPRTATRYALSYNCRNTRKITDACAWVLGTEIKTARFSPDGQVPNLLRYTEDKQLRAACTNVLKKILGAEGFHPSRVAILSPFNPKNSSLNADRLGDYVLSDDMERWQKGQCVWFSSIKAFKGLEADVLILVDAVDFKDGLFEKADLFVACSRARHRLIVCTKSDQVVQALGDRVTVIG